MGMSTLLRFLPLILAVVLLVSAVVDIIRIEPSRVRALPKPLWVAIALAIVIIGPILWFALGRERIEPRNHGRYASPPKAPDDDPEFLNRLAREKEQRERIRDLEQRLSELGDEQNPDAPKNPQ
jgi:hypothetical protein